jgi:hypothetical protein
VPVASPPSALLGRPEPRLFTPPLRKLTAKSTLGHECAEFAEQILGVTLLPWQRWWLDHALEVDDAGHFRYRTILTLIGRQSGKTTMLKIVSAWMMYLGRARLILGCAQSLDIARESWSGVVDMAQADPELAAEIETVRRANGEQELRLTNGARYRISAASRSAGRGLSVDLLILDELREHRDWSAWSALSKTTIARPNGLVVAISNAGDDESVVLNHLRDSALAGTDGSLGIFEWSAPDGCDLDDPDAWAQGSPGLGHTITEGAIRAALATDPPATFRTEVLCQRVAALDSAVPVDAWRACTDPEGTLDAVRDRVTLALDVSPDLQHVSLVAAAVLDDGRVRLEVVSAWDSTEAARAELPELIERVKPRAVGWFPGGPAASLAADLRALRKGQELKAADVPAVCQGFAEQVGARRVLHNGDPLLTAHTIGASKLHSGDGFRFSRKGGHCDCLYAAAGALHLARTLPASLGKPRIIAV